MMKRRRFGAGWNQAEDVDPMIGLVNLADVMLVFACGLMIALVLRWNVDLSPPQQLDPDQMYEVTGSDAISEEHLAGERYQPEGTVYRDTETGRLYIISD